MIGTRRNGVTGTYRLEDGSLGAIVRGDDGPHRGEDLPLVSNKNNLGSVRKLVRAIPISLVLVDGLHCVIPAFESTFAFTPISRQTA